MNSSIPTEADWRSEPWALDTEYAYGNFAGKSFEDAIQLFKQNAIHYQEDVMWMPRICFRFYAHAYIAYLMSDDSKEDSDGASCFFGLAEFRADDIRAGQDLTSSFEDCLAILAQRQDFYDADVDIYGSFEERAQSALSKLRRQRSGT